MPFCGHVHAAQPEFVHLQEVANFVEVKRLPPVIRDRVVGHCNMVAEKIDTEGELAILNMLSTTLRRDVLMHIYSGVIETVPFFWNKSDDFLCDLLMTLKPEVC